VTTVLVMLLSSVRASSAVPENANGEPGLILMSEINQPMKSARTALMPGSTHSEPVAYSPVSLPA
jgi:hypothetical protein